MIFFITALGLVALVAAVYAANIYLIALVGLFFALIVLCLIKDLKRIKAALKTLSDSQNQYFNVQKPSTSDGRSVFEYIESLRFRSHNLSNQIENFERLQRIQKSGFIISTSASDAEIYGEALGFAFKSLGCLACAVVVGKEGEQIAYSRGIESEKFRESLISVINCDREWQTNGGFFGYGDEILSKYGIVKSLCLPLEWEENNKPQSGVLWIGYADERGFLDGDMQLAKEVQKKMSIEIGARKVISEMGRKVREAEQYSKEKSDFIKHVSHDIRAPLNNIKAILSLMEIEDPEGPQHDFVEVGLRNCETLSDLVEDIMDLSKFNSGALKADKETFNVYNKLDDIVKAYSVTAKLKGINLELKPLEEKCIVLADPLHFKRIISNLLSNALKYTESGSVTVSVETIGDTCQVSVRDTGIGMSEAQLKQLFTPFTRFRPNFADGVGLGMALTKVMVEINGGKLTVKSKENVGTTFTASFQTAEEEVEPLSKMILLVDNDKDCVLSLGKALERFGYQVSPVLSVESAKAEIEIQKPALVISDSNMPDGGGLAVARFIKENGLSSHLAILSGKDKEDLVKEFAGCNVAGFFSKPVDIRELVDWIKTLDK